MVWLSDSSANRLKNSYFSDINDTGAALDVSGGLIVNGAIQYGMGVAPIDSIMMWNGTFNSDGTVPDYEEWEICDGTNGKPDLRGRFVVGVTGVDDDTSITLGTESATYNLEQIGGLQYATISESEMPSHSHATSNSGTHAHNIEIFSGYAFYFDSGNTAYAFAADDRGSQSGTMYTQSVSGHTHTIQQTGSSQAHENRPPYYVLAFIVRVT